MSPHQKLFTLVGLISIAVLNPSQAQDHNRYLLQLTGLGWSGTETTRSGYSRSDFFSISSVSVARNGTPGYGMNVGSLQIGEGLGIRSMGHVGVNGLDFIDSHLNSAFGGIVGVEPLNIDLIANTNGGHFDMIAWRPSAAIGVRFRFAPDCSLNAVFRAGGFFGGAWNNQSRVTHINPSFGASTTLNCYAFVVVGSIDRIRGDRDFNEPDLELVQVAARFPFVRTRNGGGIFVGGEFFQSTFSRRDAVVLAPDLQAGEPMNRTFQISVGALHP